MNMFLSAAGVVKVEMTGADPEALLESISSKGMLLRDVSVVSELTIHATVSRGDLDALRLLCEKRGDALIVLQHRGIYWLFRGLFSRPVLLLGALVFLGLTLYLPGRVLFVQVEGNSRIPTRLIQETASQCGIHFGASRRAVRSERVKNALLEAVPQLKWVGVNTRGCVAVISVREHPAAEPEPDRQQPGHIIALREGVIVSCTATRGTALCAPGQAVSAGELLISGYTDCGLCIHAEQAAGEVYARTRRNFHGVSPCFSQTVTERGNTLRKISLLIGKKRIKLWKDSGIWDTTCDRMYEEYYITLPGGFRLPFAFVLERFTERTVLRRERSGDLLREELVRFGETFLKQQMIAGQVDAAVHDFQVAGDCLFLSGEYLCTEMIGRLQQIQIGEDNGENN